MSDNELESIKFAASMKSQSYDLMPQEFSEEEKDFIANILYDYTCKAYEALNNDEELNLSEENIRFISQVIAEWTFHKSVDLIKAAIPKKYWEDILVKIAFAIFEVSKEAFKREMPKNSILPAVEHHVNKVWKECIEELYLNSSIGKKTKQIAQNQSNIDDMAKQTAKGNANPKFKENTNPGCSRIISGYLVIGTIISAAIMTTIFVFCYKHFKVDKLIADNIIFYSRYIGWGVLSVFFISWLFLSRFCSVSRVTLGLKSIITNISKNSLFYCGCLILSSLIVYKNSTVFNSTDTLNAIMFILASAITTVKSYKIGLINKALIASYTPACDKI